MRSLNLRGVARERGLVGKRARWHRSLQPGRVAAGLACALAIWLSAPTATQNAVADGETRTLYLYHTHTGETIDATFRVDGHYDPNVLRQLNHFLRDWRNDDEISMDPRLFDAIWEAYRTAGATDRIQIYSAYRSPETNAMLRRRSKAVAEHSQHMLGRAMDTTMPGFPMHRIREAAMKLQHGGVGWYPSANFVHIDVGGVRSWPRMPYDQLMALFPDGKTVHIASNGQTLPGYEEARAELAQRGQTELPPSQEDSGGFFAWLFGGGSSGSSAAHEDEEDRRVAVASAAPPPPPAVQQQAEAPPPSQQPPAPEAQAQPQPPAEPAQVAAQSEAPPANPAQAAIAQDGVAAQPQPQGQQVASLDPSVGVAAPTAEAAPTPMPPRRPSDLVAFDTEVPLPPIRPVALEAIETAALRGSDIDVMPRHADAIGRLITATASGVPTMRRSGLPSLITQGSTVRRRLPREALAFAASDFTTSDAPIELEPSPTAVDALKPTGLRAGAKRLAHASITSFKMAAAPSLIVCPHMTGLRKAAAQRLAAKD